MNLILVEATEVDAGTVVVDGRRASHIIEVIRPSVGDELRVGVVGGGKATAIVTALDKQRVTLELGTITTTAAVPLTSLVLAVPRPKVLARVVAAAASAGVARIDLINAWRVEKSYFGSPSLEAASLSLAARLGCEQGAITHVPEIAVFRRFMLWIESLGPLHETRVVADPRATETMAELAPLRGPICLAIGPEGGWIEAELKSLQRAGFRPLSLGPGVLRVETAVASALGQVGLLRSL